MSESKQPSDAKALALERVLSMVGLATRAGRVCSGEEAVVKAIQSGTAYLIIVAEDVSPGTKKKFDDKCRFYEVDCIALGTKEKLGRHVGKEFRAVAAVIDENLADAIKRKYNLYINL